MNVNPCKATLAKCSDPLSGNMVCEINEMNDKCYEVCDAFKKYVDPKDCQKMCSDMLSEQKHILGKDDCNARCPYKPPIWFQTPHYFPDLLDKTKNINEAFSECKTQCAQNPKNKLECWANCELDMLAVSPNKKQKQQQKYIKTKYTKEQYNTDDDNDSTDDDSDCNGNLGTVCIFVYALLLIGIMFCLSRRRDI